MVDQSLLRPQQSWQQLLQLPLKIQQDQPKSLLSNKLGAGAVVGVPTEEAKTGAVVGPEPEEAEAPTGAEVPTITTRTAVKIIQTPTQNHTKKAKEPHLMSQIVRAAVTGAKVVTRPIVATR